MKLFKEYKNCIYCGSKKFERIKTTKLITNFYLEAISRDLNISKKNFNRIKTYRCKRCEILQNSPWFNNFYAKKIFSNIYGQHNRSWTNFLNFIKKGRTANHGNLFFKITKAIKIKSYAEFNSPFMGLFLDFFKAEFNINKSFLQKLYYNLSKYLTSRQVADKSISVKRKKNILATKYLKIANQLKKKHQVKTKIKKYIFTDNSFLSWGQNDNHNSVNSKTLANEFFDLENIDVNYFENDLKLDLFGIFHTLDHTHQPKKILNLALKISEYVVVYCHVNENVEKQHLFSFTNNFLNYLKKNKIYSYNLTNVINKHYQTQELYFVCSQKKKKIY